MVLADARRKEWKVRGGEEEGRDAGEIVQKVYKDKLQRVRDGLRKMGIFARRIIIFAALVHLPSFVGEPWPCPRPNRTAEIERSVMG